jgi:hypothetical protein
MKRRLIFSLGPMLMASSVVAVELTDLAGDWTLAEFTTPSRLRETFYNFETDTIRIGENSQETGLPNEILVDAFYPAPASATLRSFLLGPSGVASGGESGQIVAISNNRLVYRDEDGLENLYTNTVGDLILTNSGEDDLQSISIALKKPETLSAAEVAGDWTLISVISPTDITKTDFEGQIVDAYFETDPSITTSSVTINAGGTLLIDGGEAGTFSIEGTTGTAQLGPQSIPFQFNASKNVMTARTGDDNEEEFLILVKTPSSLSTSDLAGTWRLSTFRMPTVLFETYLDEESGTTRQAESDDFAGDGEILVDFFHPNFFETKKYEVQVSPGGTFTGVGAGGAMTANADGSVTVDVGEAISFYPNAGKDFMIGRLAGSDDMEFLVMVKTSDGVITDLDERAGLATFPAVAGGSLLLNWNADEGLVLEESSELDPGLWVESPANKAGGTAVIDPSEATKRFFRIAEKPEEEDE